jgi:Uma2 family endonuclease
MAVESTQQIEHMPVERWRFTVDDFQLMGEVGIFGPEPRVELIDGEIYPMNPIGPAHSGRVMWLNAMFATALGSRVIVSIQNPLQFRPRRQPQPDVTLLRPRDDFYTTSHPTAADVLLLIEVADFTLTYDCGAKAQIYAQAGLADYWIVDLTNARVLVFRQPTDGVYRTMDTLVAGDTIQPLAFPDLTPAVSEILI